MYLDLSSLEYPLLGHEQLFFMHIPKTAGTTLIHFIEQQFGENEIARWLYPHTLIDTSTDFLKKYRYFHGHVEYGFMRSYLPQKPFAITMLRDPVERYLSNFGNHKRVLFNQIPDINLDVYDQFQEVTLIDFVYDPPPILIPIAKYFQNIHAKFLASKPENQDQEEFNRLIKAKRYILPTPMLEQATQVLEDFSFIGLTERFQDSIFLMAYTFGWLPITEYKNFNMGQPRPYQDKLPSELTKKISALNDLDEKLYKQGKQLFETRFEQMNVELLERYGDREHALVKPPLPVDVMTHLLNKHHQKRYLQKNPSVSTIKYYFDGRISGVNWQTQESHPVQGKFRWSGPGAYSTLILPLKGLSDMWLKISVIMLITDAILPSLKIKVNGDEIYMEGYVENNGSFILEGYMPKVVLARNPGYAVIAFDLEKTFRPIDIIPESQDDRFLGIAINWVEVTDALPLLKEMASIKSLLERQKGVPDQVNNELNKFSKSAESEERFVDLESRFQTQSNELKTAQDELGAIYKSRAWQLVVRIRLIYRVLRKLVKF